MTRTWHINQSAVQAYCRQGAENRAHQMLAGRAIRYREERLARYGRDGYDGWHELTEVERDHWADRARDQFATSVTPPASGTGDQ